MEKRKLRACSDFQGKLERVLFACHFSDSSEELFHFESCAGCHEAFGRARDFFEWCHDQRQRRNSRLRQSDGSSTKLGEALDNLGTARLERLIEELTCSKILNG